MRDIEINEKIQQEKQKLHVKYLIGIAICIAIFSIVILGHNQKAFVSQFSFASTITSIILSAIAIWMSITGERSTNEIKDRISDTASRLNDSTYKIENASKGLEENIDVQNQQFENMKNILNEITEKLEVVRGDVKTTHDIVHSIESLNTNTSKIQSNINNSDFAISLYDSLINSMDADIRPLFKKMIKNVLNHEKYQADYIINCLMEENGYDNDKAIYVLGGFKGYYNCFSAFNYNEETKSQLLSKIE